MDLMVARLLDDIHLLSILRALQFSVGSAKLGILLRMHLHVFLFLFSV